MREAKNKKKGEQEAMPKNENTVSKPKAKLALAITLDDGRVIEANMTSRPQAISVRNQLVEQGLTCRLALIKEIE